MKKKIVLASVVAMFLGIIVSAMPVSALYTQDGAGGGSSSSSSKSTGEKINEAKSACEARGGSFTVKQVYADGTFSSSCSVDTPNNTTLPDNGSGGSTINSGSDDGGSDYGTGTGVKGNTDNSDAKGDSECPEGQVYTNFFGKCMDVGENGSAVFAVLNVILQVLTWGIGIAGTVGIVITGIQYMTARDDVTQMTKAKNRLIQIVIGLAIYAVMWAFLQWILPGGVFGN